MPTLPTLTVTQAQMNRITAAFGGATEFQNWLTENIAGFVVNYEAQEGYKAVRDKQDSDYGTFVAELNSL